MEMGILADAVVDARSVFLDQVHDPPPTLTGARKAYLRGVAGRDLVMLDAARLLGDKSLVVNEEVEM
jgi:purine-binding chemotaxis protein CheW